MKAKFLVLFGLIGMMLQYQSYAQYQFDPEPADTMYTYMYAFDTSYFVNCFLSDDPLTLEFDYDWDESREEYLGHASSPTYSKYYAELQYYTGLKRRFCDSTLPEVQGYVIGANCLGDEYYAEAFAQDFHLRGMNDNYVVCGVAIKLNKMGLDDLRHLTILNNNFDTLSQAVFHTLSLIDTWTNTRYPWNRGGWNMYYFPYDDYDSLTNLTDFKIGFDVPLYGTGNHFRAVHTCNVYSPCIFDSVRANGGVYAMGYPLDTVFYGILHPQTLHNIATIHWMHNVYDAWLALKEQGAFDSIVIPLCDKSETKYIKHSGDWVAFENDPVYELYRNIQIAMVPIIMIPKQAGALSEVELQKMCYLYPNPAKDYVKVLSHFDIRTVQLVDISGRVVREQIVNTFEGVIDTRGLSSGTYIVKINTVKGSVEEKLIIQ